jgi:CRISPR-associated endonuclease Csn1
VSGVEIYYFETDNAATRKPLDTSFNAKAIESITDTGIRKILLNHLAANDNNPDWAFSPEGIDRMNQNIKELNGGNFHQPIYKARIYEPIGNKFPVGYAGNKKAKYVEAAKGTNLFFAIYADENGNRSYETIPLNIVVERLKQGLKEVPEKNEKGHSLLFSLSPNDLVYVPTGEEIENPHLFDFTNLSKEQKERIYKIVSFTNARLYGLPYAVAFPIANKQEFTQLNKVEFIGEHALKENCWKIKVDRLGNLYKKG